MKKILCTLCIAAAFVSCNLDEFPLDKLAPENYFNNEEELKTFRTSFDPDMMGFDGAEGADEEEEETEDGE